MEDEIYRAALEHYGTRSQEDKLIEEMAELMQAILKVRRKPTLDNLHNLHEEFADVKIVMAQLETSMNKLLIDDYTRQKLTRLRGLIKLGNKDTNKYKTV